MTNPSFLFRWLGVAGMEFNYDGFTLLIDPYLSRISLLKFLFGKVQPDERKIFSRIIDANALLVTHSHFDHLMDVPVIAKKYNSTVYGSPNTCALLERLEVPPAQIQEVAPKDEFTTGPFHIQVIKSSHPFVPFSKTASLPKPSKPPQRALDFGMDSQFAYRISIGQNTLLTDPGIKVGKDVIDILFISTLHGTRVVHHILKTLNAAVIIPIHWDNYFKALPASLKAPGWGLLPCNRVFLKTLKKMVYALTPRGCFFIPEPFKYYSLEDILNPNHEYPSTLPFYGA